MKIFISWSGERSNFIAKGLKQLLPDIIQEADVWMSEHDIQAGARWSEVLASKLSQCNIGIACLTPENLESPWLLFEAGAISKSVSDGKFIPFLFELDSSQVKPPISQFQLTNSDLKGITKVVESLNSVAQNPLSEERLERQINRCWPEFKKCLHQTQQMSTKPFDSNKRTDSDILKELLSLVRSFSRQDLFSTPIRLWIDTSVIGSKKSRGFEIQLSSDDSVSDFLDAVWFGLSEKGLTIPSYTYGVNWVLSNNRTGEVYSDIGRGYISSKGKSRDNKPIYLLNLINSDTLTVYRPEQTP